MIDFAERKEDQFSNHIKEIVVAAIPTIGLSKIIANAKCHKVKDYYFGILRVMKKYSSTIIEADLKA